LFVLFPSFNMLVYFLIAAAQAYYGGSGSKTACLDYSEGQKVGVQIIKEAVGCYDTSKATFVGWMCNPEACGAAVKNLGGTVFKWGGDGSGKFTKDRRYRKSKAGWKTTSECWMEGTTRENVCDDKINDQQYDLYKITGNTGDSKASLVKKSVECKSGDTKIAGGAQGSVLECRNAVKKQGGKFFIFGRPREGKDHECWMEYTSSASCPQGWEKDKYDFWQVENPTVSDATYSCAGRCGGGSDCDEASGQCRKNGKPATTCRGFCGWGNCCNMNKIRCEPCGVSQAFADAMTVTAKTSDEHGPSFAVNALAVFGFGVMLYGAGRFYFNK